MWGYHFLLLGVEENAWCVLGLFHNRWIMKRKEMTNKILVSNFGCVKFYMENFHVRCYFCANFFVSWVLNFIFEWAHEPNCPANKTVSEHLLKVLDIPLLRTPIAPSTKRGHLLTLLVVHLVFHWSAIIFVYVNSLHFYFAVQGRI